MKHSDKIIFILAAIGAIFLVRAVYPDISGIPFLADADGSPATSSVTEASSVPLLTLLQTAVASVDTAREGISDATATDPDSTSANSVFVRIANTPVPAFSNEAYMVADLTTGDVLAGSDVDTRWPTASITKLMTATLIFDQLATSTEITITPQMFAADPSEMTLVVGGTYTVEDLLHVMLMPSSNVAAEAMADYIGRTQFMAEMNQRAQQWGMNDTYFDDPSGISAANESTAHDLLVLAQHVYNDYPGILAITDTHETSITDLANGKKATVTSINDFAGEPEFIGGKTGHTDQAGDNLLSIFDYNGHPVITIVLDVTDRFGDTSKLYTWFRQNFK
jgi:serine-type D-Ala-D-Ala endopeptidase (penicillin-binding protein 7)